MDSAKELVMEYEFRQFGIPGEGTDRAYWLYPIDRKSSPLGLVEYAQWENFDIKGRRYLVDADTLGSRPVEWLGFIDALGCVAVRKGQWSQYDIVATLGVPMDDYLDAAKVIIMSMRGHQ